MPILVDATRVVVNPSVKEMLAALEIPALQLPQGKVAVAVSRTFQCGVTRMFATYAELRSGVKIRDFKNAEEARE